MASISYQIGLGGTLETITTGSAAPTSGSGFIELRIDQTAGITDGTAGSPRAIKRGEVAALLRVLEMKLIAETNIAQ